MLFSTMVVSLAGGHDVGSGKRSVSGAVDLGGHAQGAQGTLVV
ncbi:hypothetical protein [Pseudomonas sp. MS19]|nr:hypothetical protein [Pseudomonas sp. MS19]